MEGFVLEDYDYKSILADVENLTDLWLKHKLLCFREAHLTPDQLSHVMSKFGSVNKYFQLNGGRDNSRVEPASRPEFENSTVPWMGWESEFGLVHLETHALTLTRNHPDWSGQPESVDQKHLTGVNGRTPKSPYLGWHIENPYHQYPQICSAFTMPWKSCSKDEGETGFVNYGDLYNSLPDYFKDLTRNELAFIEQPLTGPSKRLFNHMVASDKFCSEMREGHYEGFVPIRPVALPHSITGEYSIRHHPGMATGFMNPDISTDVLYELKKIVMDFTINEDNQFWWQWTVGDFLLVDFWMMCHSVSDFPLGERSMLGCFGYPLDRPAGFVEPFYTWKKTYSEHVERSQDEMKW